MADKNTEGALRIPVVRTDEPCEECGATPALKYNLSGIQGVLCRPCLQKEVDKLNQVLKEEQE